MKKIISYAIFGAKERTPENAWIFYTYMRGIFFNALMNRIIYPDFITHIETDSSTFSEYDNIFYTLQAQFGATFSVNEKSELCRSMLWRLKPIFFEDAVHVLCRDADSITTYREAQCVQEFMDSKLSVHGITDDPAHGIPLMGGMCGFNAQSIRDRYGSWEELMERSNGKLSDHGTDQDFLLKEIYPEFKHKMFGHFLKGYKGNGEARIENRVPEIPLPLVQEKFWTSNLTCRHIGSPGVVEMETIRFFKANAAKLFEFGGKIPYYPKIFTWWNQ